MHAAVATALQMKSVVAVVVAVAATRYNTSISV